MLNVDVSVLPRHCLLMHPILLLAINFLREHVTDVRAIYRFGSWGTPDMHPSSDLDLAFLTIKSLPPEQVWTLAQDLAMRVGCDVDLIDLRAQSTEMRMQVISTGERVWCGDFDTTEMFEDFVYSDYVDFSERRRGILDDIRERGSVYGK